MLKDCQTHERHNFRNAGLVNVHAIKVLINALNAAYRLRCAHNQAELKAQGEGGVKYPRGVTMMTPGSGVKGEQALFVCALLRGYLDGFRLGFNTVAMGCGPNLGELGPH